MLISTFSKSYSTTWDEPWADKVIKEASSFVLAKVISTDSKKGIIIEIIKTLGGNDLKGTILISDFYLLSICSTSGGHGAEFETNQVEQCFFFIKQNIDGKYCIATPTTGFDYVSNGEVTSTFRHSYHQASVPLEIYEKTMTSVFNNYHNIKYDEKFITDFVNETLSKKPAGFSETEIKTFFLQHVALECIYHLRLKVNLNLIIPFLNDTENFHSQISGARAIIAINTVESKQELLKVINDKSRRNFVKVICIWSLEELNAKELKSELQKIEKNASEEDDGFGGNIMDPRICTSIPTVKAALENLLKKLE